MKLKRPQPEPTPRRPKTAEVLAMPEEPKSAPFDPDRDLLSSDWEHWKESLNDRLIIRDWESYLDLASDLGTLSPEKFGQLVRLSDGDVEDIIDLIRYKNQEGKWNEFTDLASWFCLAFPEHRLKLTLPVDIWQDLKGKLRL